MDGIGVQEWKHLIRYKLCEQVAYVKRNERCRRNEMSGKIEGMRRLGGWSGKVTEVGLFCWTNLGSGCRRFL